MLPLILNSLFVVKFGPYSMRHTNNFVGTICKSNMRSLNVIMVALNNWNKLSNHVKLISSYTSYKVFIKAIISRTNVVKTIKRTHNVIHFNAEECLDNIHKLLLIITRRHFTRVNDTISI